MLAAALVARVEELAAQLEQSRTGSSNTSATTTTSFSCPAKKAAQMLGVSIASLQRLEKGRELRAPTRWRYARSNIGATTSCRL